MNNLRISLSRIIAINWYGFRKIIDVDNDILVSGATGTGKSALLDLVQYVLLGDRWKANRAATGNAGGRDLAGYCLGDTNTMRDGERHFLRASGASFIGLEWTWPEKRGEKKEPRRETWGMRIEFSAPGAKPKHLYFCVPARLEMPDIASDGRLVSEDDFRSWLRRENGSNYNQCVFPTQKSYLDEMAHRNHLAFDRDAFTRALPKAIAFELDKNVETFIRNFILEENPLDVREVKTALGAYEEINTRLRRQEKEADFLRRIHAFHDEFEKSTRKAAVHRHAAIMLKLAQEEERRDKADAEIKRLKKTNSENIAERDKADARIKTLEGILTKARQDPDAVSLNEEIKTRDDLRVQVERLRKAQQSTQKRLNVRHRDWTRWLQDGARLTLPGITEKLDLVDNADISALGNTTDAEENRFAAMRRLAYTFSNQIVWKISPVLAEQKTSIDALERQLTKIRSSIEKLEQGEMTGDFPILEAIRRQLGNREAASQLARHIEVRPDAEKWWPVLETLLDDNRHTIVLRNADDYSRALAALRGVTPGERAEHLLNPNETLLLPATQPNNAKTLSPGLLSQKITVEHPAVHAFVQKLIGDIHCAEDAAALDAAIENGAAAAVTPDGHFARPPLRGHLQSGESVTLTLGKAGLERARKRLLARRDETKREKENLERQYRDASDWLNQARESFHLGETDLPDYTDEIAKLPELEEKYLTAKSTVEMLSVRKDVVKRQQELDKHEKEKTKLVGRVALLDRDISGHSIIIQPQIDARDTADGKITTLTTDIAVSRATLGEKFTDVSATDLRAIYDDLRAKSSKSWPEAIEEANRLATEADGTAGTAKANRNNERRFLATARDETAAGSFPLNATYSDPEYNPETDDNTPWKNRLDVLEKIELAESRKQAESCRAKWEELLQKRVLQGLKERAENARRTIDDLRKCLRTPIRGQLYNITQTRDTRNYAAIWSLLTTGLNPNDPLADAIQDPQVADAKKMLQDAIKGSDDPNTSNTLRALLDYRNYHNYDITVTPADRENAAPIALGKKMGNLSGGENQAPFFISMLAAFRRVYAIGELSSQRTARIGLVVMDEAFSKLSGDGIEDCLELARNFQLQLLMAFPPERLGVMLPHAETVIVCRKEEERGADGYITRIDNIAIPLPMKEALDILE